MVLEINVLQNCFAEVLEIMSDHGPLFREIYDPKTLCILTGHQRFIRPDEEVGQARITGAHLVNLQLRTETIVWCKARLVPQGLDYEVLIEPKELKAHTVTVAARSLAKVVQGRGPVHILNCSGQIVTLPRYTAVAKLYRVYD